MKIEAMEAIANAGSKTTAGGAVVGAAAWGFLQSNAVGLLGFVVALLGVLVNVHYKRKADKRRAEESRVEIKAKEKLMDLTVQDAERKDQWWKMRMAKFQETGVDVGPPPSDWAPLAPVGGPWTSRPEDDGEDDGR